MRSANTGAKRAETRQRIRRQFCPSGPLLHAVGAFCTFRRLRRAGMPSSGRENLGWKIGNKDRVSPCQSIFVSCFVTIYGWKVFVQWSARPRHQDIGASFTKHRERTDVVPDVVGRPRVFLDIAIDATPAGRIVCELFNDVVPKTAENFRLLCLGTRGLGKRGKPLHYKGVRFHRIVPNFVIQAGDFTHGDGTGGESVYGPTFPDENLNLKHTAPGLLSMANSGKEMLELHHNSVQACPHLDGKHCVFGRVIDGMDVARRVESCGQEGATGVCVVDDCGEIKGSGAAISEEADCFVIDSIYKKEGAFVGSWSQFGQQQLSIELCQLFVQLMSDGQIRHRLDEQCAWKH
eukprot:g22715.t1